MSTFTTRPLAPATWPAFESLAAGHNGVFGGCWCLAFHEEGKPNALSVAERRVAKAARVRAGTAHAALVFEGEACVGWCQFGSSAELPRIKNRKAYEAGAAGAPPAWRITCFFVDRHHRRQGVAAAALAGALEEIAALDGGAVEAYPEDTAGRPVSPAFLHAGTLSLFEAAGFSRERQIGKNKWVVRRTVGAHPTRAAGRSA